MIKTIILLLILLSIIGCNYDCQESCLKSYGCNYNNGGLYCQEGKDTGEMKQVCNTKCIVNTS